MKFGVKQVVSILLCVLLVACASSSLISENSKNIPMSSAEKDTKDIMEKDSSQDEESTKQVLWFENEPAINSDDLAEIEYIKVCQKNPPQSYMYMSKAGRSAAIAFTDGRVIDFGSYGGEIVGDAIVSFDGDLVCRVSAPLAERKKDMYARPSILSASWGDGPLKVVTKDYTQYMVLEHKKEIFFIRNTPKNSGLFHWFEGVETLVFAEGIQFVCSANGAYVIAKSKTGMYVIEMASKTITEITNLAIDNIDNVWPLGISNTGEYIYYAYGVEEQTRQIACAQYNKKNGESKVLGEVIEEKHVEIVFNYDGTQAIIQVGERCWAFSPHQGLRQTNDIPKGVFQRQYRYRDFTNENGITFINSYDSYDFGGDILSDNLHSIDVHTCATANFDENFASMVSSPPNIKDSDYLYYNLKEKNGFYFNDDKKLYSFEIIDNAASEGEVFATNVVNFSVSADYTKIYYLVDPSDKAYSENRVFTAELWYKTGREKPKLLAENVCYHAIDIEKNSGYRIGIEASPDGSKVTFVTDFDLASKQGALMISTNCGEPEKLQTKAAIILRIDNNGDILFLKHLSCANTPSIFQNFYNLHLYKDGNEVLLDRNLALAWYT